MCPLSVALFELFTVCSAKMDEPIDGKASNRLRYTLSVVPKSALESFEEERTVTHVLDGGSLLQRIAWKKGDTFEDIASMYMKHVSKNFLNPVVVFDGYESGPTTKDMTHNRRSKGVFGQNVICDVHSNHAPSVKKGKLFVKLGQ